MTDYSLPLIVVRKLANQYENAMLKGQQDKAYQIAHDLVEMTLKLQDIADAKNSTINC